MLFTDLVTATFRAQPEDPAAFMIAHLQRRATRAAFIARHRGPLNRLFSELATATFRAQPEDPIAFIIAHLRSRDAGGPATMVAAQAAGGATQAAVGTPQAAAGATQAAGAAPATAPPPPPPTAASALPAVDAAALLAALLHASPAERLRTPVRSHAERLKSGERGLSLAGLRALRAFYEERGALGKVMGDVCKEPGFDASVCALTRSTGLSLAESLVLTAADQGVDAGALVGHATTFFSYSWYIL